MRTNIYIDDNLMADAQRLSGAKTKKEAVEQGLRLLVQMHEQQNIKQLRGKLQWDGDLDQMRQGIDTTEPSA
ncbi:type II toxin-antitoxin system VapB family antitoxin [uncultured Psychrobacter sp.]|uniref:type II toxin-antitoxin system VapB family antitoxin n=1 Tax=uncultured Psychrobacter sp. TaxID=259303 RepID=UPI003459BC52